MNDNDKVQEYYSEYFWTYRKWFILQKKNILLGIFYIKTVTRVFFIS